MGCHGIAPPNQGRGRHKGAFWGSDGEILLAYLIVFEVKGIVVPQERPAEAVFWLALASLVSCGSQVTTQRDARPTPKRCHPQHRAPSVEARRPMPPPHFCDYLPLRCDGH